MIPLALFLLPYVPRFLRPWLIGLAIGRRPYRMTEEEDERLETKRQNAGARLNPSEPPRSA
jgi:hypothetical protein